MVASFDRVIDLDWWSYDANPDINPRSFNGQDADIIQAILDEFGKYYPSTVFVVVDYRIKPYEYENRIISECKIATLGDFNPGFIRSLPFFPLKNYYDDGIAIYVDSELSQSEEILYDGNKFFRNA